MTGPTINAVRFDLLADTIRAERGEWTTERAHDLLTRHGHDIDEHTAWGMLLYHANHVQLLRQVRPGVFVLAGAVAHAEQTGARADAAADALFGNTW